jgi:hypothetical protein
MSFPFVHSTEKPAGAPVAPALIVNVMDPGVELKHNTVNGANGGLILPLLSCTGLDWPAAYILLHATSASSVVKVLCIFICAAFVWPRRTSLLTGGRSLPAFSGNGGAKFSEKIRFLK